RHTRLQGDWSSDVCSSDLEDQLKAAKAWLLGALCHLGTGAKTAAGYGYFQPANEPIPTTHRKEWPTGAAGAAQPAHEAKVKLSQIGRASCRERVEKQVGVG